jgi:predicted ferric reductase
VYDGSAKPRNPLLKPYATATAIIREITYASLASQPIWKLSLHFPPLGRVILLLSNLTVVLILCFYKLDPSDQWQWENIGYRTGFIGLAQLPLIFLLAGKKNIIGALTGFSYERLNCLHRWTARTLWLTITIHMMFWFRDWARYDYIIVKLTTDPITKRGFAAWCILTFIVLTSFPAVRKWNYELFVLTHLVTFAGFTAAVWLHVPNEVKYWVWIPIGIFAFDRLMRARRLIWSNIRFPRRGQLLRIGNSAILTPLPGNVTRITISNPLVTWSPGQHVFLSCHSVAPLQSHPFTIASIPSDKKLEFIVRAERGGTKRLLDFASKQHTLPLSTAIAGPSTRQVFIEGPYGKMRPLRQFDTLVFFAGSTGATFTMPLLRDVVHNWQMGRTFRWQRQEGPSVVRRIRFIWVIKARDRMCWFSEQLDEVVRTVNALEPLHDGSRLKVEISIYITRDESFTKDQTDSPLRQSPVSEHEHEHGKARQLIASNPSIENLPTDPEKDEKLDEKERDDRMSIHSAPSFSNRDAGAEPRSCGPNGTCCCTRIVSESSSAASIPECTCHCDSDSLAPATSTALPPSSPQPQNTPSSPTPSSPTTPQATMRLLTKRPSLTSITRQALEQALGETAVVVCGPRGLREGVRRSVVQLSDERAVHRGTGAQGVWLHGEGFEY